MKYKSLLRVVIIFVLALLSGCNLFKPIISVNNVELDESKVSLSIGENYTLRATVYPRNATNQKVIWSSSDETAVIVSPDGLVYAISRGVAIITVTTDDGGYTSSCIVEVEYSGEEDPNHTGNGSLDSPFSADGAIGYINGSSYNKDAKVYVKGKISSIKYPFSEEYGTAVFSISDDGKTTSTQFTCYSVYYLENKPWVNGYTQVSVGDDIIAYGTVLLYNSSVYETTEKQAFIYSINGRIEAEELNHGGQSNSGVENGHEWVDMGLPSGIKWATCNVGASSNNEAGALYSWGEITTKDSFSWENYRFTVSGNSYENIKLSKYVTSYKYGTVDNKVNLELNDDVANVEWGGRWRMPNKEECEELLQYCTWEYWDTGIYGKGGWILTSKINGNSLILPFFEGEGRGDYWSSSLSVSYPYRAWRFYCNKVGVIPKSDDVNRFEGFLVRPVLNDSEFDSGGDGTLNSPYNAAGAIEYIKGSSFDSDARVYVKGKISYIKYYFSTDYGTAVFDISDDGNASSTQFKCYSIKYLGDKYWQSGYSQIKIGDEVIAYGKLTLYNNSIYETLEREAYIYSLNGKTKAEY